MVNKETDINGIEISREQAADFVASLQPNQILWVYSGRIGCACGCRGKYRYNPDPSLLLEICEEHGDEPGRCNFSSRSVSIVLKKLKGNPNTRVQDGYIVYLDDEVTGRSYSATICHGAKLKV